MDNDGESDFVVKFFLLQNKKKSVIYLSKELCLCTLDMWAIV